MQNIVVLEGDVFLEEFRRYQTGRYLNACPVMTNLNVGTVYESVHMYMLP